MRTVIDQPIFAANLSKVVADDRRADEFLDGLRWQLARDPRTGIRVDPCEDVWAIASEENAFNLPSVIVYYAFNDENVFLLDVCER